MTKPANSRKARFRAALNLAGMTAEQWAQQQEITPGHLSRVLHAKRESPPLIEKIDEFIRTHLKGLVAA